MGRSRITLSAVKLKALKLEAENAALLGKRVKSKTAKAGIMFENVKTYAKIKREL